MRAVFYTHTAYFESAMSIVRALSARLELHVLMEVSPRAWQLAGFDVQRTHYSSSIVAADRLLKPRMPDEVRTFWREAASFNIVLHDARRFYAPGSLRVSLSVLRMIRDLAPDVVHFDSTPLRLGLLSVIWPQTRYVLSEHDPRPHAGRPIGESTWPG